MSYNKLLAIVTLCLTTVGHLKGQTQFHETNKIIPPSPTAAALGQYGSVPVSMYNGSPNITVPIYDISTASNSLKIFMQYDASGTRVQQDASWAGLGWSLNAGGVITRTVKQIDDFKSNGYYFTGPLPSPQSPEAVYYAQDVYYGNVDAEQDVFSFNFNGYSGRFVLGKRIDGAKVYMDEKSNLKIEYLDTQGKWVITTSEGYIYTFSVPESAVDYSLSGLSEFTNINGVAGLTPNYGSQPVTSWYLSSIVSPKNDLISFEYVNGKSLSMVNKSEAYSQLINIVEVYLCPLVNIPPIGSVKHVYTTSRQAMTDVYLKKINFTGGFVEFNTTTREDIEYINSSDGLLVPSKLDNIVIKKADGSVMKKYNFSYSYFNSFNGLNGKRLKLDNITEYSANNTPKPPFTFVYNNPNDLPDKQSKSIDYWGFYNNKTNYTLLPSTTFSYAQNSFIGADREPENIEVYPSYGVLKEIQYPTGGKTQFDYELHDYSNLTGQQKYILTNKYAEVRSNSLNPSHNVQSATFVILPDPEYPDELDRKIPVEIRCNYQKVDPNISNIALAYSNMRRLNANGSTTSVAGCQSTWDNDTGMSFTNYNLPPGTYEMYVQATNGWSFFMAASWKEKQLVIQKKGGGIRVKRITDQDAMGKIGVRRFQYVGDDGKSSGILITNPVHFGVWAITNSVNTCRFKAQYGIILSGSLFSPGLMSSSGIVGYTKVTELIGENGENGKTEHYFYNVPNQEGTMLSPLVGSPYNGKESITKYLNVQNDLIKQKTYQYIIGETGIIPNIKIYTDVSMQEVDQGQPLQGFGYIYSFYNNISRWTIPFNETETILNGSGPITTIKSYTYANQLHRLPTQMIISNSNNKEIKQEFNYPHEMVAKGFNPNNVYSNMIANNMISPAIEVIKSINGVQSERTITNYSNIGAGNIIDKSSVEYQKGTSATETRILYEYTATGNIRAVQNPGGPKTVYLWGYNNTYPVAEIKNATYQDIIDVLGQSNIDLIAGGTPGTDTQVRSILSVLRTDERFRKSLVTIYTYNPLIGITSMTDAKGMTTYYEYDGFQRLINIKDKDGNIIKHTDYHYQGQ